MFTNDVKQWCSRQESNLHRILRKDASYPLNDGSNAFDCTAKTPYLQDITRTSEVKKIAQRSNVRALLQEDGTRCTSKSPQDRVQ
jgi:hypothetical protein